MNEIVKAGLVGAAFLGIIALLIFIAAWLDKHVYTEQLKIIFISIIGILIFILISVIVGSVLLAGAN